MPWYSRWRNVFRDEWLGEQLDDELEFHIAETVDRLVGEGVPEQEAHREARRRLGNYSIQKERTRDMDIAGWLEATYGDFLYGLRQLKLNPGFAAVAVSSLALGIGANTAIFQLLDAIRLRGLPVKAPQQLVTIERGGGEDDFHIAGSYSSREQAFTYAQMAELQRSQKAFSDILTFWPTRFNLSAGGQAKYGQGLLVSSNYFDMLGVQLMMGRGFPELDAKTACPEAPVILSAGFWQREYGGSLDAIGKSISLDGHRFTIGGVAPSSFNGLEPGQDLDVVLPLCTEGVFATDGKGRIPNRTAYWLTPIARLKPGWTVEQASKHVENISPIVFRETVAPEYKADFVKKYLKNKFKAVPAANGVSPLRRRFSDPLWILLGIAGSVLLIACANLANLLLARASVREREMAIRRAVGASRARVIGQMLAESLLLATMGAGLGLCLAQALSRAMVALLTGDDASIAVSTGLNWHVFGFLAGLAILTCLLSGFAPAIRASGGAPMAAMRGGRTSTATRERNGLRRMLVVTQVALSLVLLVAALLFSRSLGKLLAMNLGFNSRGILIANVSADALRGQTPEQQKEIFRQLEERIKSLPGVASAATTAFTPLSGRGWNDDVHVGKDRTRNEAKLSWFNRAGVGYFATMETPLKAGREFDSHDNAKSEKVAIVNEAFAKTFFAGKNPVGQSFWTEGFGNQPDQVYQIVGLVATSKYSDIRDRESSIVFLPANQDDQAPTSATFVIRGRGSLDSLQSQVLRETGRFNPNLLLEFRSLEVQVKQSVLTEQMMADLSAAFGVLAVVLSTLGLYGVVAYMVEQRKKEIGVRVALGATRGNVLGLIAKDSLLMVTAGLILGLIAAVGLGRFADSMLFELNASDPLTVALAAGLLTTTAVIATWIPAQRAAGLEPVSALREE